MNFCQLSNALGVFIVVYLLQFKMYFFASAVALAVGLSCFYHHDETNVMALYMDMAGCVLLVSCLFYMMLNASAIFTAMNAVSCCLGSAALTCYVLAGEDTSTEDYKLYHTGWHVFVFYSMAAFVYSYVHSQAQEPPPLARSFAPKVRESRAVQKGAKAWKTLRSKVAARYVPPARPRRSPAPPRASPPFLRQGAPEDLRKDNLVQHTQAHPLVRHIRRRRGFAAQGPPGRGTAVTAAAAAIAHRS